VKANLHRHQHQTHAMSHPNRSGWRLRRCKEQPAHSAVRPEALRRKERPLSEHLPVHS